MWVFLFLAVKINQGETMILGLINVENVAYTGETIRIDSSRSISTPDESIVSVTIKPDASSDPIECLEKRYVDCVYTGIGEKTVTLNINGTDYLFAPALTVKDPSDLNLFSSDTDLVPFEPDVFKYLPDGWSKFTRLHVRAQDTILDFLDEKGIQKTDTVTGSLVRYVATDIFDVLEVRSWSVALVLAYLFEGLSNQVDDIFSRKAEKYQSLAEARASRSSLKLKSPNTDDAKPVQITLGSSRLVRG